MNAAQKTFISSTNWTERIGPTAAIATIKKYQENNVSEHLISHGELVKSAWRRASKISNLEIKISGLSSLANFQFCREDNLEMQTAFTTLMLDEGFLAFRQFKPSYAHKIEHIEAYSEAIEKVFKLIANNDPKDLLKGPIAQTGFQRLTKE